MVNAQSFAGRFWLFATLGRQVSFYANALKIYNCFYKSQHPKMQTVMSDHEALFCELI